MDFERDGFYDHIRVIVGWGNTSTNQRDYTNGCGTNTPVPTVVYTILGNQHCIDRWHVAWDYGVLSYGLLYVRVRE